MTQRSLRVGVAGAGMVARVHLDAARRAGARIVGIAASTPERSEAAAAELAVPRAYPTAEALAVSEDVDVVHVCTPNAVHRPLVEAALAAGKHVVCEKPLALDAAEATALADLADRLAERDGRVTAVPFVYRYHPMAAEAQARACDGALGDIRLLHGHYLQDWLSLPTDDNWRVRPELGGASRAFADIGSHWCDLAEWITGHRVSELTATVSALPGRPTEDAAHVLFRTDRGATGTLTVSQVSPGRKNRLWIEVDGSLAGVAFDQENPETLLVGRRGVSERLTRDAAVLRPGAARLSVLPPGHPMGYADCFAAFVRDVYAAVAGRRTPPYPTFRDAARTAAITDAVLASARTRTWIEVGR